MKSDVYLVAATPAYGEFPYDAADDPVRLALGRLWRAWGRDPDNPFEGWVRPGGAVVVKPNWVMDYNPLGHGLDSLVTHLSLIRHVIEACAAAMGGKGVVIVGDCPLQGCDFPTLLRRNRMAELHEQLARQWPELKIEVQDWRLTVLHRRGGMDTCVVSPQTTRQTGDAAGLATHDLVDLGRDSFLEEISDYARYFRVTMYKPSLMLAHHRPGRHEYMVVKDIRNADLLINLPKLKTHIKTGLSAALKNLVGINGLKEFLPHHIRGAYFDGGDCYCRSNLFTRWADRWYDAWWEDHAGMSVGKRRVYAFVHRTLRAAGAGLGSGMISAGSWSGNETLWRTILDLNHLLYFREPHPKRIINLVDGVIAGQGKGPLQPTPHPAGLIVAGENPACVDAVLAHTMGYNISRIPMVYHALTHRRSRFSVADVQAVEVTRTDENGQVQTGPIDQLPRLEFSKPKYWRRAAGAP
jgi:uncharacterized protein (DUF362 family)